MLRRVPGLAVALARGLSKLNSGRLLLADPRSALFFDLVEKMKWVEEIAESLGMWCLSFVENVWPDEEDMAVMTKALGWGAPVLACSRHLSRVRRQWSSGPVVG